MLTRKGGAGLLKIADLGVSAELALVFTNIQIGTPHYMAPGEAGACWYAALRLHPAFQPACLPAYLS